MKAQVVIGSNFGDEGKGLVTDYLCNGTNAINVRHNGGSQAGHTVVTDDGKRHVFSHIGAGTFAKAPTFLSRHFVVNPITFMRELEVFDQNHQDDPTIFVHAMAPIATPYDVILNQIFEISRARQKHGSCGVGINETIRRTLQAPFALYVKDLLDPQMTIQRLQTIAEKYIKKRLQEEGIDSTRVLTELNISGMFDESILQNFVNAYIADFLENVHIVNDYKEILKYEKVVFEGAQGLLLDEHHKWFPHVTRSRTGIHNVVEIMRELELEEVEAYYTTRAYLTRHGAGPLPYERSMMYHTIKDDTNITNRFQGALRFAPLNLDLLREHITADIAYGSSVIKVRPSLVITCMDQVPDKVQYVDQGIEKEDTLFLQETCRVNQFETLLISHGPTRSTVWEL